MKRVGLVVGICMVLVLMVSCSGGLPPPAEAVVNGVTKVDRESGRAELSVSALDNEGNLLTSGTVSGVRAEVDQDGFSVAAGACNSGRIEDLGPLTAMLTLDASYSMSWNDPSQLRATGAKRFVDRMGSGDVAAISSFEDNRFPVYTNGFVSDKDELYTAIDSATYIGSGTPLWDAAVGVINYMSQAEGSNKVAIIFTDGEDTGSRNRSQGVIDLANQEDIKIFMIGLIGSGSIDTREMLNVATQTSGFYADADDADGLESLFNRTFNASKASGCIDLIFQPVPTSGITLTGGLNFRVNNREFSGSYEVTF